MSRNGLNKWISVVLLVVGLSFCLFPVIRRMFPEKKSEDVSIARLKIPVIDVDLPIYEDVEEEMLEQGVGHIKSSSLPGGGAGTYCLLVGHRGLPRAELLVRLGEVKVGDFFLISTGKEEYTYCVRDIQVIRPDDTQGLVAKEGRELVSLITCTPYAIHTHRLVVTGERVK